MFHLAFFRKIYVLNSVQSICDSLAIDVYEANARICLEVGDFSEFNQCQSCLRELYITNPRSENKFEFWAYRILYATALEDTKTVLQEQVEYANTRAKDAMVRLALDIAYACRAENYVKFFTLLKQCTYYGKLILHKTKWALRFKAITLMLKAYSPAKFPVQKLIKILNFSSEKAVRLWLNHIRVIQKDGYILCKESQKTIRSPRFKVRREGQNGVTHNVL
uniref:SAC3/GANP/THP3 conserved domain-containing protein n=1 Tax=Lotharella globosa TaxID=91324 RepID=A0A6V3PT13_9EUKA|mmetsp:Transcript_15485/g.31406  ORF Transcript_15485/g.31406 Transcript_15485/m.31406 type:complete len:221 (+) Transcript_15485:684-1346(+)